jgi:hypothetical protein
MDIDQAPTTPKAADQLDAMETDEAPKEEGEEVQLISSLGCGRRLVNIHALTACLLLPTLRATLCHPRLLISWTQWRQTKLLRRREKKARRQRRVLQRYRRDSLGRTEMNIPS